MDQHTDEHARPAPGAALPEGVVLPDDSVLAEVEELAVTLAHEAGAVATDALQRTMEVSYKTEARGARPPSDPVSEVDHAVEARIRQAVGERFPDHEVLGEEVDFHPGAEARWVWAIDPIDGTTNFINGFPFFAVSVGVLYEGVPVVGAVWCATSHALRPGVYHARRGGGLSFEREPLERPGDNPAVRRRLAGAPGGSAAGTREWDHRVTGSTAIEVTYVAAGLLTSARFGRPSVWDVAAGLVLVHEAGCEAWTRGPRGWERLARIEPPPRLPRGVTEERAPSLRDWRQPLIVGAPEAVEVVRRTWRGPGRWRRWRMRLRRLLRR